MTKKFFVIFSITLATILIVLLGYYFLVQKGPDGNGKNGIFKNFFPFGGSNSATTTPNEVAEEPKAEEPNFALKLRKISNEPVAGAGILDTKAGSVIRYIEKSTGHVYEVELFSPKLERISNTTIPLAYDAVWGNKNNSLAVRYLRDDDRTIDTYSLNLKEVGTSTEKVVSATAFPVNISDILGLNNSLFYLIRDEKSSTGYISDYSGKNRKQIWNSEIRDVLGQYVNLKTVALTTRPEKNIAGFMYFVDTGTGSVKKVLGGIGLSGLVDPDANQILFITQSDGIQMSLLDKKLNVVRNISPVTFPEKCVWSKKNKSVIYCAVPEESLSGTSLISWYKGFNSFNDSIWKYDLKNNTANIIISLYNESNETIDVIKPILSENEQYLIFVNKIDDSLWSLDLLQ